MESNEDLALLFRKILKSGMEDYVRLRHPKARRTDFLNKAFSEARDMFFDEEWRIANIKNSEGEDCSLQDLMEVAIGDGAIPVEKIRENLIAEAQEFWSTKFLNTITIPTDLIVDGHTWVIVNLEDGKDEIHWDDQMIYLAGDPNSSDTQERLLIAIFQVLADYREVSIKQPELLKLAKSFFAVLRMNNCFTGAI